MQRPRMHTLLVLTVCTVLGMSAFNKRHSVEASVSPPLSAGQNQNYEDDGTQLAIAGTKVHICPGNGFMVGVDAGHNRFMCNTASTNYFGTPSVDTGTEANIYLWGQYFPISVHVCPTSQAMVGWS